MDERIKMKIACNKNKFRRMTEMIMKIVRDCKMFKKTTEMITKNV